jgi:outer membrane immunogenic protein
VKRLRITVLGFSVLVASPAIAADMVLPYKGPPLLPGPVFSWTGFYVGAALGAKWADTTWTTTSFSEPGTGFFPDVDTSSPRNYDLSSLRYGGYVGYNWQVMPQWVWGLEADFAGANKTVTTAGIPGCSTLCVAGFPGPQADTSSVKIGWDASVRARLGYLVSPDLLAYVTGGIAWQDVQTSATCQHSTPDPLCVAAAGNPFATGTASMILGGWTIGGGLEYRISGNWLLRGEYRYSDFSTWNGNVLDLSVPSSPAFVGHSLKVTTQTATAGITYKFGP